MKKVSRKQSNGIEDFGKGCEVTFLDNILRDGELRSREFPVTRDNIFLAHAATCPLPMRVARAIRRYIKDVSNSGQFDYLHRDIEIQTRELVAKLLHVSPDEVAFTGSTSLGLSLVAAGLEWEKGDNVVIAEADFPANVYPWLGLKRKGVEVKFIPHQPTGVITLNEVREHIDKRTRLVSLSSVHYLTGATIDLDAIGAFLRERGILFCVDAIQSLGALPCSVKHVDFLSADAHKWLLGPQGIAIFFVRRDNFGLLYPALLGWKSVREHRKFTRIKLDLPDCARRYEPGSLNIVGLVGLHAALLLIQKIGIDKIANHLADLRTKLISALKKKGYEVLGISSGRLRTGITSFKADSIVDLYNRLDLKRIVVSLRDDLSGNPCIRVSPHFYNTENEIDALLSEL